MEYKDIKAKLRKPSQFICTRVSVCCRDFKNANERLADDVRRWVKDIVEGEGKYDQEGYLKTPFQSVLCKGTKEECQSRAEKEKFAEYRLGSTSRLVQLGLWKSSWRVLPADENGNWVPSTAMIKKALESL